MLSSALSMMFMANLLNVFFRSAMLFNKASMGDKDSLKHTLELFLDFVSIFVRILVILLKNAGKEAKPAKNRSGRR
ncbi:hypothetical protein BBJ28_00012703 [Nothophytophthora sp. Chile5]|nr:hypothetical protein BBJ28_00012703 [Nothophytophthora sp. Chile5]